MHVIQIGEHCWKEAEQLPADVQWLFRRGTDILFEKEEIDTRSAVPKTFEVVILDGPIGSGNLPAIREMGAPYTYFYTDNLNFTNEIKALLLEKQASHLDYSELETFVKSIPARYFDGQHGSKLHPKNICVSREFISSTVLDGNRAMIIHAEFGSDFVPVASWRHNMFVDQGKAIELWLEHYKTDGVDLQLRVNVYRRGGTGTLESSAVYSEKDLREMIIIKGGRFGNYVGVELLAKGAGTIELGPLHFRASRLGAGQFLVGGRRHCFDKGQEFISYFNPGDRKPPLNVYFSGYRTAEGFEGYFIMNSMKSPFLLIGDPRLEGGAFYLGSKEFEDGIVNVIQGALDELGFTKDDLILSGMSMGTFGAVYYGSVLEPHAVIIGKPLMNLGDVAVNEKRLRPGGFPTSLDVLRSNTGGNGPEHVAALNKHLWDRFDAADFSNTEFAIGYMFQDDYDINGFPDILEHLRRRRVVIVSKGMEGRHNDNTSGIVHWFMSQYRRIIRTDFGREVSSL